MPQQVELEIQYTRDTDPATVSAFFESAGNFTVEKNPNAGRGETGMIQIILMLAGPWVVEKYVLDPLAARVEEWVRATTSLEGKRFRVSVSFQDGRLAKIETFDFSNPGIVRKLWQILKSASDLLASQMDEIPLNLIKIVPGKADQPMVIGYRGTRPTHLLDLSSSRIVPIDSQDGKSIGDDELFAGG